MLIATKAQSSQSGFTLVETLMALLILAGGLLALAGAFVQGMSLVSTTPSHQLAKEKATEAMESVFTSRDSKKIASWDMIQNQSRSPVGIFQDGARSILNPGTDGLVNTNDDGAPEVLPGPDGQMGTADDQQLTDYTREIEIRDVRANLRQIRVIVRYRANGQMRQYQLTSFITPFS
jgi:prepilin-type N-terminal cleavage/methylation domain-containing protein